ncbi:MAG TPA: YfhO family protein, partial [Bacteroidota bacterium]|nr:YfhO family protein [Bacteroidota bacterium]
VDFFREEGKKEFFRVNSREQGAMLLDRNQGMVDRIFLMEGYTPLGLSRFIPPMSTWERTCDLMNAKYRIVVDRGKGTMTMAGASGYAPRAFVVHASYVAASPDEAKARISDPSFDPMTEAVFEAAPPVVYDDSSRHRSGVTIDSYRLNQIRMTAVTEADGYLVLSEVWYPGWKAYVDGVETPVLRADWCLRALPITAGRHAVTMEFSPSGFRTGAWVSSLTLVLSIAGAYYRRKKENA